MKTLVCSHETDAWLSHHKVGFPERDNLLEELYPHLEFLSRNSQDRFGQIPIKIDFLRIVLELEIDSTTVLIIRVRDLDECP
jgi:hypothetical protein